MSKLNLLIKGVKTAGAGTLKFIERNPKLSVGGAVAYAGWDKIFGKEGVTDKIAKDGVLGVTSSLAIGNDRADYVKGKVDNITGFRKEDAPMESSPSVNQSYEAQNYGGYQEPQMMQSQQDGVSSFLGNTFGGNGMNMFGNFFSNLFSGRVSGMSIAGLLAGAWMMFSRFGMWGKIGGALLAMMMIGNNSQQQSMTPSVQMSNGMAQNANQGMENGYGRGR